MSLMKTGMWGERERRKLEVIRQGSVPSAGTNTDRALLEEEVFASMLYLERRRAERAKKRFVLMIVDVKRMITKRDDETILPSSRVPLRLRYVRPTSLAGTLNIT